MMQKSSAATADGKYLYRNYRYYPHTENRGAAPAIQRPEGMTKKGAGNGKNNASDQRAVGQAVVCDPEGGRRALPGDGQYAGGRTMRGSGGDDLAAVPGAAGPAETLPYELIDALLTLWAGAEWAEIREAMRCEERANHILRYLVADTRTPDQILRDRWR